MKVSKFKNNGRYFCNLNKLLYDKENNIFSLFASTIRTENIYTIPYHTKINGLLINMIPQGICVVDDYIFLSAYDSDKLNSSKIYVINKAINQVVLIIHLKEPNNDILKCHLGGLAVYRDKSDVYILMPDSDCNRIYKVLYDDIYKYIKSYYNECEINVSFAFEVDLKPSFISVLDKTIFIGNFEKNDINNSCMMGYSFRGLKKTPKMLLPLNSQGVEFYYDDDITYMIVSTSYGRYNPSKLFIYKLNKEFKSELYNEFIIPNMSEDIAVDGNNLLICFESGANKYLICDESKTNKSIMPLDYIISSEIKKLLKK